MREYNNQAIGRKRESYEYENDYADRECADEDSGKGQDL